MSTASRLYVSNLPYSTDATGLEDLFKSVGTVTYSKIVTDRETGRSKGFGFVEMGAPEQAERAISSLNGSDLGGRTIMVAVAREKTDRPTFNR